MKLRTRILLPSILVSLLLSVLGISHYVQVERMEQRFATFRELEKSFQNVFDVLFQKMENHFDLSADLWQSAGQNTKSDRHIDHQRMEADISSYHDVIEKFLNDLPIEDETQEARKRLQKFKGTLEQYFSTINKVIYDTALDEQAKNYLFLQTVRLKGDVNTQIRNSKFAIEEILHHFDDEEREAHLTHLTLLWLVGFFLTIALTISFSIFSSKISAKIQHVLERFAHLFPETHIENQEYQPNEALIQLEWFAQRLEDTQHELAASRTRFEKLISHSSTAIYVHRHMVPLYANDALVKLCGYDNAQELMALPSTLELLAPHERRRVYDFHEARLRGENAPTIYELEIIRKDGQPRWVLNKSFAFDWEGETAICTNLVDITERKKAEQELENSEDRFRILLELTPDPIFIYRKNGQILEVNTAACRALGYTRGELLRLHMTDFTKKEDAPITICGPSAVSNNGNHPHPTFYQRKNGTTFPVEVVVTSGMLDHQSVLLAIVHDMTQTMAHILELDHMREQAEKASEAKSDFLSMMSHELRTPLNSIIGYSNLYLQKAHDTANLDKHMLWVDQIHQSGQNLLEIVDKVLELIAIDKETHPEHTSSSNLIESTVSAVDALFPLAEKHGIKIRNNLAGHDPVYIKASDKSLHIILENLLSNAIKFNRKHGHVDIDIEETAADTCVLCITDSGQGMAPDQITNAFKPFERLGMENSTIPGSGIGLALVEKICAQIGAKINASSMAEAGCRFEITLPKTTLT